MSTLPRILPFVPMEFWITKGPHKGQHFEFKQEVIQIGRGPENHIVLENDPKCSRKHFEVRQEQGHFFINILNEKNQITVNGQNTKSFKFENSADVLLGESEIKIVVKAIPINIPANQPIHIPQQIYTTPNIARPQNPNIQIPPYSSKQAYPNKYPQKTSRSRFYIIVGIISFALYFLLFSGNKKKVENEDLYRGSDIIQKDLEQAESDIKNLLEKKEQRDNVNYRRAQENFIKGFRDFQQGQYDRARESFRAVLSFDPDNQLAKRYYNLSNVKFDESLKHQMSNGRWYLENKNYRMCQSSFFVVMGMLQNNQNHPNYLEAKKFYQQCKLNLEGKF